MEKGLREGPCNGPQRSQKQTTSKSLYDCPVKISLYMHRQIRIESSSPFLQGIHCCSKMGVMVIRFEPRSVFDNKQKNASDLAWVLLFCTRECISQTTLKPLLQDNSILRRKGSLLQTIPLNATTVK